MSKFFIYVTFSSVAEAETISRALLEARLVACANIFPAHQSLYWWQDKIESGEEVAVIFKSTADLFDKIEAVIKSLHSYDVPCIVAWPIEAGHAPFLDWIGEETAG